MSRGYGRTTTDGAGHGEDLMDHIAERGDDEDLRQDFVDLRESVGLEKRESSSDD
ncbi:MAG: hypothetical protein ACXWYC_11240 [Actinomycetota bacterium]